MCPVKEIATQSKESPRKIIIKLSFIGVQNHVFFFMLYYNLHVVLIKSEVIRSTQRLYA